MKINIEIDLDENLLRESAKQALLDLFILRRAGFDKPLGHQLIADQVEKVLSDMDFSGSIKTAIDRHINGGIIVSITEQLLRKKIRDHIAVMQQDGILFDKVKL